MGELAPRTPAESALVGNTFGILESEGTPMEKAARFIQMVPLALQVMDEARDTMFNLRDQIEKLEAPGTIRVPAPHVPYGPKNTPENEADAEYLRHAARWIEEHKPFGSNLTATVAKLLRDAADAREDQTDDSH